jgi:hypothetical protein
MIRRRQRVGRWAAAGGLVLMLAACGTAPRVTFDGSSCNYDGPRTVQPGGFTVTFNNTSDQYAAVAFLKLPDDGTARTDALALVGKDLAIPEGDDPEVQLVGTILAEPGEEATQDAPLPTATFVIDCAIFSGDQPSHAWRAAAIDVKE